MAESNSCLEVFSRTLLIILNVIIVLCGIGLIAVQSWAVHLHQSQESENTEKSALIIFLVNSLFIEYVAILGIVAGIKAHKSVVLNSYIFCMVVMLICTLIFGIIFLVKGNINTKVSDDLYKDQFMRQIKHYAPNTASKIFVDYFQDYYDCCGSESYLDWNEVKKIIPESCCREDDCSTNVPSNVFDEGCAKDYKNFMQIVFKVSGYYGLGMVIAQFICIVCAIVIAIKERRSIQGNFFLLQPTNDQNLAEYEAKNV